MDSPNVVMRDPVIYRIRKVEHHRTGDKCVFIPCMTLLTVCPMQ